MIINLIHIRFKQLFREISRIGIFRILILLGMSAFVTTFLFQQSSKSPNAHIISILVLLFALILHRRRVDKVFLKTNFNNFKWIFFIEYLSIALIPIIFLLIHGFWTNVLGLSLLIGAIVQFDFSNHKANYNTKLQRQIPAECFEWKSGVRKLFPVIITIWLLGFTLSFFIASVPIALAILGIISISFQEKNEPLQMVLAFEKKPHKFLYLKVKQHSIILLILFAPLLLIFQVFHYQLWYIPLILSLIFCSIQAYAILVRYAFYTPHRTSSAAQIFIAIGLISSMTVVAFPIVLLLSWRFYFKAKQNLNFYLNDYH